MSIESCITGTLIILWMVIDQLLLSVGLVLFLSALLVIVFTIYGVSYAIKYWETSSISNIES